MVDQGLELRYHSGVNSWLEKRRGYSMGYSGTLKYAQWVIERVDASVTNPAVPRDDEFRPDPFIPPQFAATLADYKGSGYARGHLCPAANRRENELWQSDTFLLSNMCPQVQAMNGGQWRVAEDQIRALAATDGVRAVWCISLPLFEPGQKIETIGEQHVPVPHWCGKAVLSESGNGRLRCYGLAVENDEQCSITPVGVDMLEHWAGVPLFDLIPQKNRDKMAVKKLWF